MPRLSWPMIRKSSPSGEQPYSPLAISLSVPSTPQRRTRTRTPVPSRTSSRTGRRTCRAWTEPTTPGRTAIACMVRPSVIPRPAGAGFAPARHPSRDPDRIDIGMLDVGLQPRCVDDDRRSDERPERDALDPGCPVDEVDGRVDVGPAVRAEVEPGDVAHAPGLDRY